MRKLAGLVGIALMCSASAAAAQVLVAAPVPAPVAMSTGSPCMLSGPAKQVAPSGAKTCMACGVAGGQQVRKTWTCDNGSWGSTAKCAMSDPCNTPVASVTKVRRARAKVAR